MHDQGKNLYFIALLPPENVQQEVTKIKHIFAEKYHSKAALKSPPHITLQPPFKWESSNINNVENKLKEFVENQSKIPLILNGFAAFKPRVIYVNVIKNSELLTIYDNLTKYLENSLNIVDERGKNRTFSPHITVGYRDLTRDNFKIAWSEFKDKPFYFEFTVAKLTLLIHNGKNWQIKTKFEFKLS